MIQFRQKDFAVSFLASTAAMVAPGLIQGHNQNKKNAEQQEEFQRQNAKLQEKQNEAMNRIAKAAEKDPSKVQAVQSMFGQKEYAAISGILKNGSKLLGKGKNLLNKGGTVAYEFAQGIGKKRIGKTIGNGLAMGTTMAIGSYALDKAIQADRKKITGGAPLPSAQKSPEELSAEKKKKLRKLATGAVVTAGTILAARKGALGSKVQNLSKGLNSAGTAKMNLRPIVDSAKHSFKKGMTGGSVLAGAGFAGLFALPYLAERRQLKDQVAQQKQYTEEQRSRGSVLKKAAIGTLATVGTIATLRRAGPTGLRKGINDMYMTYGNKLAGKTSTKKLGDWMMKSGSEQYGKAVVSGRQRALNKQIKAGTKAANGGGFFDRHNIRLKFKGKDLLGRSPEELQKIAARGRKATTSIGKLDANNIAQERLRKIQTGKASRKIGQGVLEGISSIFGINKKRTTSFLNKMTNTNKNSGAIYSKETQDVANFLKRHKRTAAAGTIGLGLVAFKPFEWGDAATKKVVGAIDKNAYAYEKSKEQPVLND